MNYSGIRPIYGQGFFHVDGSGAFTQVVVFDYYDPAHYYAEVVSSPTRFKSEVEALKNNMQFYLDQEKVVVNGERVRPRVVSVEVGLRRLKRIAYAAFVIEFEGQLKSGLNIYENYYEEEYVGYDYAVYWFFPRGSKVIQVDLGVNYSLINDRIMFFKVPKGAYIRGCERIMFEVK